MENNTELPLMFLLLQAYSWFDDNLQTAFESMGEKPLTRLQSMVMSNVAAGVGRPSRIARNLGLTRQSLNHILAELKRKNLIEVVPEHGDLRAKRVQYSEDAAKTITIAKNIMSKSEEFVRNRVGNDKYNDMLIALKSINEYRAKKIVA